jgi:hypothetical protein
MANFYHGGWGMYPTCALGILLVSLCVAQAFKEDRGRWLAIGCLGLVLWLVAATGFLTGVIRSTSFAGDLRLVVVGVGEALNNIALASAFSALAGIPAFVAIMRFKRQHTPRL